MPTPPRWFPRKSRLVLIVVCVVVILTLYSGRRSQYAQLLQMEYTSMRHILLKEPLYNEVEWDLYTNDEDATRVPCDEIIGDNTMVALILGQSNAANSIDVPYTPTHDVFMYHDHACYKAKDPLLGASASGGSIWSRLGDKLVERKIFDKVLLISVAHGGSSILDWGRRGTISLRLGQILQDLKGDGILVTHVLFNQGETDCRGRIGTPMYAMLLRSIIEQTREGLGVAAPFFISPASRYHVINCQDLLDPNCYRECPSIIEGQLGLVASGDRIFAGPNTDELVPIAQRPDGSHFSSTAAEVLAEDWAARIAEQRDGYGLN